MNATILITLSGESCTACGIIFGLESRHQTELRRSHKTFWCPGCGSRLHYDSETDAEREARLRKAAEDKLVRERASFDQERARLKEIVNLKESQRRAEKGAKTKLKKRVAAGVCPCCNRTFSQLSRHMETKHPEYVEQAKSEPVE